MFFFGGGGWNGDSGGDANGKDSNIPVLVRCNCQLESSERRALLGERP